MDIFNPEDPRDALPPTVPLTKSYVNAACSVPLNGITVGEAVEAAAEKRPDHLAYIFSENGLQLTYKDVLEMTRRAAKSYLALGLVKGDHVVIAGVPDENYLSLMFGAVYIGLVINTPAYIFRPKEVHIKQIISKVEPKAFILNPGRNDVDYKALQNLIPNLDDYSLPNALDLEMFPTLKYIVMATSSERREFNLPKFYSLGASISDADLTKKNQRLALTIYATPT